MEIWEPACEYIGEDDLLCYEQDILEFIYITEGTLELGMGQELFHMEEGDFAVIFPDVIHHYQVFSQGENKAVYLWAKPALAGQFADVIQSSCPQNPVIKECSS